MIFPLISIIVITYNSSKYIFETLESAKNQQYDNLELIISDDFSNDDTLEICTKWINENKQFFVNVELVKSTKNTGIAPNINRGIMLAKGEWVKFIAGDDILLNNCISDNYNIIKNNNSIKILFTNSIKFIETEGRKIFDCKIPLPYQKLLFNADSSTQLSNLISYKLQCPAPSSFIHKKTLLDLGALDEDFPFYEDFPLWVKCAKNNIMLCYKDVDTVFYRQSESVTRTSLQWYHKSYYNSTKIHFNQKIAPYLKINDKKRLIMARLEFFKFDVLIIIFKNKKTFISKSFNYLFDTFFFNKYIKGKY